jgi:NodT family efflux transporter outer membrane factor (OMF) lipoprotein
MLCRLRARRFVFVRWILQSARASIPQHERKGPFALRYRRADRNRKFLALTGILRLRTLFRTGLATSRMALAAAAGALILTAGCTVGPDYVRPTTVAPETYKEMAGWKVAEPKDELARGAWWEIYHDPELNALEEKVNISNQNIATAEAQFRQARALVRAARAAYFPTVAGGAAYSRSRSSSNLGGGSGGSFTGGTSGGGGTGSGAGGRSGGVGGFGGSGNTSSDYLLPLDVTWELDVWGRIRRTVESNRASAQASAADLEGVRLSVQTELAQDYFQLRALDAQKQLFDETVAAFRMVLDLTRNRYAKGVASSADVLQAETQLKTTQAQAIDIGVQRAQLEHAIALLVGKPASIFSVPVKPIATNVPPIPFGVPSELLERRPDIAAAERRMAAANAQIGVAVAAYFPTVTLSASGGLQASHFADWIAWPSRFWSIGAVASQTVFEGGLRRAQTDQARAAYDANVATYRQTVLTGFQEVEDNLAALRILEEEAGVQDEAVQAAKQSVVVSTNQYKAGTISHLDLLVVQTLALNNERTAIDILSRRLTANALLVKALGGGWTSSDLPPASGL